LIVHGIGGADGLLWNGVLLGFCPLPRVDGSGEEFLPIDECEQLLDKGDDLATELSDLKRVRDLADDGNKNSEETKAKEARDKKVKGDFNWTKLRHILICDECSAPRCVFSKYAIGNAKGPTKEHMVILKKYVEEQGYRCGDAVRIYSDGKMEAPETEEGEKEELPLLFCRETLVCWNTIESQYYAGGGGATKGGRMQTKLACCHCYSDRKLADDKYIEEKRGDVGGKKHLPICEACVDDGAGMEKKKGAKTNKLKESKSKRKRKAALREDVRKHSKKSS